MSKNSILKTKSFDFAVRTIKLYKYLVKKFEAHVISQQVLRAGTSIGALIREAEFAESRKDFVHKLYIGLKEANEINYWIDLLFATDYIKMLVTTVKTTKRRGL